MTNAKTKDEWIKAWKKEVGYVTRIYQCKADPDLYDRIKVHVNMLNEIIEEIADRMEQEGTWSKTSMKAIKRAYDEARNCGYVGSIVEYCLKVGVNLEDLA